MHPFFQNLAVPEIIELPSGKSVRIPKCEFRLKQWRGKPIADDYGHKAVVTFRGTPVFAELLILLIFEWSFED